jgi:membrane fusion protein (multidrug efflux system)
VSAAAAAVRENGTSMKTSRAHRETTSLPALLCGVLAVLAVLLSGCDEEQAEERGGPRQVPVSVTEVAARTLHETVRGIGTLRARDVVELRPEISARVVEITFTEGQRVSRGEVLFRLDDSKLEKQEQAWQARLAAAEVRRENAQRRLERFDPLAETKAVSGDERDQVETAFEEARAAVREIEAELERVRENLDDTTIEAPFDGIISESLVDAGDFVTTGDDLATLYDIDPLEAAFTVPGRYVGRVREGQQVSVGVDAFPDEEFRGEVHYVSPALAEATRDYLVKALVGNPEARLKPGAFAAAVVTVETHADRPVVPEQALVATRTGYIVYVVEEGKARRRDVRIGVREPGVVEVVEGVSVGDRVVAAGHMNLSDGTPVAIEQGNASEPRQQTGSGAAS